MALKKTLTLVSNFGDEVAKECYIRVVEVRTAKTMGGFAVEFLDAAKLEDNIRQLYDRKDYSFYPTVGVKDANIWAQAYEHLKTLDEYAGAEDV